MENYRIKEIDGKFYPRYRKLLFFWGGFRGEPYWDYNIVLEKKIYWHDAYFNTFEEANDFLIDYIKQVTVKYHKVKE